MSAQEREWIGFNSPYTTGKEIEFIKDAINLKHLSGKGNYTQLCQKYLEKKYSFNKCLLTTSCTDALEMAAILIDIKPGDEVIVPSFTFVSTANAFVLRGAKIVFIDSSKDNPNLNTSAIEGLINHKTKAILVVHYAGVPCDMNAIINIASLHNLYVIEDAAQAIDSYYQGKPLGSFGNLSTFSFHETKNIQCGEGGMLVVNDKKFIERAEIIRDKGTNRGAFMEGKVDKYSWIDIGSSFLPSELTAAFLYAQLLSIELIQNERKKIWEKYYKNLYALALNKVLALPSNNINFGGNAHMFYIICKNVRERNDLIKYLEKNNINAVFHYQSLHSSPFYIDKHDGRSLPWSDYYSERILRLPLWVGLYKKIDEITGCIANFYNEDN